MPGQSASTENAQDSVITELERAMRSGSHDKCAQTLRRITDLFLVNADRFNEDQIGIFDDVLVLLIQRIETKVRVELSTRLAVVPNAPIKAVQQLARDDEIAVAEPVLSKSPRLTESDLIEIVRTKSQRHLLAISARPEIKEAVTDALLDVGDHHGVRTLVQNAGARFSYPGFETLAARAETNESLAEVLGPRPDIPPKLLRKLIARATKAVLAKLMTVAHPATEREIRNILDTVSKEVAWEATAVRDFTRAEKLLLAMHKQGRLNEDTLLNFAKNHKYQEMVAALALLCSASTEMIDRFMRGPRNDGLLIPCRAAKLSWPTVNAILRNRFDYHSLSAHDQEKLKYDYSRLSLATAQRLLGYWQARMAAAEDTGHPSLDQAGADLA